MTVALEDLRDEIRREELSAGLDPERPLTRADIERRRRQIAQVGLLVFFGIVVSTLRANVWGSVHDGLFDPDLLRAATITAAGGFIAYVVEKVLQHTLDRLRDLVGAHSASIRLMSADGQLRVAAIHGPPNTPVLLGGVALATRVGLAREPMLLPGANGRHDPSLGLVLGAPILFGEQLLGVIQLGAEPDAPFGPVDIEIVSGFAERVALALNHSRLYEDALVALDTARTCTSEPANRSA